MHACALPTASCPSASAPTPDLLDAEWERDPETLAREYTRVTDGAVTVEDSRVTLLREAWTAPRAPSAVLDVEREDDVWTSSGRAGSSAAAARGHQEFSPELCV